MAFYHFAVFLYLWEQEKFLEHKDPLRFLSKELKESKKEMSYWFETAKIKETKNPAKKLLLRAKRKLFL